MKVKMTPFPPLPPSNKNIIILDLFRLLAKLISKLESKLYQRQNLAF